MTCCGCNGLKFVEIGITANQLERLVMKANGLDQIERHIKTIDVAELDMVGESLAFVGAYRQSEFIAKTLKSLTAMTAVLDGTKRKLSRTPEIGPDRAPSTKGGEA